MKTLTYLVLNGNESTIYVNLGNTEVQERNLTFKY